MRKANIEKFCVKEIFSTHNFLHKNREKNATRQANVYFKHTYTYSLLVQYMYTYQDFRCRKY